MPAASQRNFEMGRPLIRSSLAVISETTRPAPRPAAIRRKGASVTPDIGARKTRLAISISPIFNGLGRRLSEPVTQLSFLRQAPDRGCRGAMSWHSLAHKSWAVKLHAYTLASFAKLASAVQ